MNRSAGVLESSPVQQMIAGSPNCNWWSSNNSINNMRQPISQQPPSPNILLPAPSNHFPHYITAAAAAPPPPLPTSSSISLPLSSFNWQHNQELPESWSQLLLGGLVGEEDKSGLTHIADQAKKLENWEEQILHPQAPNAPEVEIKQENSASSFVYGHGNVDYQAAPKRTWSQMMPISSPKTCATSLSGNMLDFSNKADGRHPPPDECNSTAAGGAVKKPRVHQPPSTHSTFKVRKEKLGDRITALHQLVSPFGKTDTASVLLEAIGYIRFLQSQIEALSLPYLGSGAANMRQHQSVHGERNCLFPEDPGQLLNDKCTKRKGASEQEYCNEEPKDLRTRGLCLVPISCTLQVGNDNGADYWAPAALGGGFR